MKKLFYLIFLFLLCIPDLNCQSFNKKPLDPYRIEAGLMDFDDLRQYLGEYGFKFERTLSEKGHSGECWIIGNSDSEQNRDTSAVIPLISASFTEWKNSDGDPFMRQIIFHVNKELLSKYIKQFISTIENIYLLRGASTIMDENDPDNKKLIKDYYRKGSKVHVYFKDIQSAYSFCFILFRSMQ